MQLAWLIAAAALVIIELLVIYFAQRSRYRAALISATPLVPVKELATGPAKVSGKVVALSHTLESPMTFQSCVYYRFTVQEKRSNNTGNSTSSHWATVIDDRQHAPCGVDDGTGVAGVRLADAELTLDPDTHARTGMFNDASSTLEQTLRRYGRSSQGWIFNKSMRYTETVLCEGDPLFVLGRVEGTPGGNWEFVKGHEPLLVSDKDESGLRSHYTRNAVLLYVLAGVIMLIAGVILMVLFSH